MTDLRRLEPPRVGDGVFEPHIAIDPRDTHRAAAVAAYPNQGNQMNRGIWCWQTSDGGVTWTSGRVNQGRFDGEGAGDPLVAYAPDGALVVVALDFPKAAADNFNAQARTLTRLTSPTIEEVMKGRWEEWYSESNTDMYEGDQVCIARSEDHGRTWAATLVPDSAQADKPALAIDQNPESPFCGHLYLAWVDMNNRRLAFARSRDGGRTAEHAIQIGPDCRAWAWAQIVVGPDGVVHVMWHWSLWRAPDVQIREAESGIFYARSDDGGATFSDAVPVAEHGKGLVFSFSVAVAPNGALLAVWSEAEAIAPERGIQPRTTIRWIHSEDGTQWTEPASLAELSSEVAQGLPAATSTSDAWHVLSYDVSPSQVAVRIYTAAHSELAFSPTREIATRGFGVGDIYLHGSYQLRLASDIAIVGDYVGLAGAESRLATAIVLPEHDDWRSTLTAYAGIFAE